MLITVTAPKKGLGQSVTTICLAARISVLTGKKTLMIDLNQYAADLEGYLSEAGQTRGLDEFINLSKCGLIGEKGQFHRCVQSVHPLLDMMTGNHCFSLDQREIDRLLETARASYSYILVDTIAGSQGITEAFAKQADRVMVVLNQERKSVELMQRHGLYHAYQEKLSFIANRWQSHLNGKRLEYHMTAIKRQLKELGFDRIPVHVLPMDAGLMNACNSNTLLHFSFLEPTKENHYHVQIDRLARVLLPPDWDQPARPPEKGTKPGKSRLIHLLYG